MSKKKIIFIALIIPIILALIAITVNAATRNISKYTFLHANDIFCISKSQTFYAGPYTINPEFTVGNSTKERALAYAICSRTEDASNNHTDERVNHKGDSAQWAVWKIIGNGSSFSYFKDYSLSQTTTEYGSITKDMYSWGQPWRYAIYDRAMAYANYEGVNAPSNIIINNKTSDNKVKIDLGDYNTSSSYTDTNPSTYGYSNQTVTLDNLGGVKSVKLTIDGQTTIYTGSNLTSHLDSSKRYFVINNAANIGTLEVEVKYYEVKYIAKGKVLSKANSQYIISATGEKEEEIVATKKASKVFNTDVSLQKYITKVNGNDLTSNETTLTSRKNKKTATNETNTNVKDKISGSPAETNNTTNVYKRDNVVQIEVGDEVTYRIYVYNNSNVTATRVLVKDTMPYTEKNDKVESLVDIVNIKNASGNNVTYTKDSVNKNTYYWTISNLGSGQSTYFDVTLEFKTYTASVLTNTAWISSTTPTNKTDYRTLDRDYIQMKPYKVSLQKIVYSVNGHTDGISNFDRWTSWESQEINDKTKYNNPVEVQNGDYVTYAIRVKNDGDTSVTKFTVKDTLPEGISGYKWEQYSEGGYLEIPSSREVEQEVNYNLNPGETYIVYITTRVTEPNISVRVLKNYAEIKDDQIVNKNNITVTDTTPNNNQDADYIQLKDITIGGYVWNDKAFDKVNDDYNNLYDESKQENKIDGIKVYLYRGDNKVTETTTANGGQYSFSVNYIKGPKSEGTNRWAGTYYSYYVVFEYDGITYTSSVMGNIDASNYTINSNAKEDNGPVKETRQSFNDRFSTINNQSGINYNTKNEDGKIPQSNHIYDVSTMAMQSSTNRIDLSNTASLEEQLNHVNLGLRGRDIFDLELTSDVYSTKVTVNGQSGEYNYNSNKVTVRKSDISVAEDAANFASEVREATVGEVEQTVRSTDIDKEKANQIVNGQKVVNEYSSTGLGIEVTYKITVTNASQTDGTATKVINYYDSKYTFKEAYSGNNDLTTETGNSGDNYKSVIITTPGTNLTQSQTIDIYVVYTLNNPTNTLNSLVNGSATRVPTYNMAEVYEYTTKCRNGQTEYTRGLLDKDSAPGSAETEKVRLTEGSSDLTTVGYYFAADNLSKLKYEDDTYAAPTLYFTSSENGRTLSGAVFRDNTITDSETRIKTGNGIQDEGEVGVYGATVELVELNDKVKSPETISNDDGTVRYQVTTNENGAYTFTNFLPGNYVVRYHYGDTTKTVLLNQSGDVNKDSFNGEDYQSTNNIGAYGAKALKGYNVETSKFENTTDWYAYNEKDGVSTGTDNTARRKDVSRTVTDYTDDKMTVLNNVRDNKDVTETEVNNLITDTKMYSTTPNFTLSVEKTETDGENKNATQKTAFSEYAIGNMNFGIAEVPVTIIDLQKHVAGFEITDSAGDNTIASLTKQEDGSWKTKGDVLPLENTIYDISVEDEKLQGARLEVTYDITANITVEKNFDGKEATKATINSFVDYIDNDLSYNESLGQNSTFWEVTTYDETLERFKESEFTDSNGEKKERKGKLDPEGKVYTQIIKAKAGNPLLGSSGGSVPITLEKTLSASETTVGDIITSSINTYEYDNNVEITNLKYENTETEATGDNFVFRDRVRTPSRNIILAGSQYDTATSETIAIHPPTGNNNNMVYYIIAVISLIVLSGGIVLIKKYAIKK